MKSLFDVDFVNTFFQMDRLALFQRRAPVSIAYRNTKYSRINAATPIRLAIGFFTGNIYAPSAKYGMITRSVSFLYSKFFHVYHTRNISDFFSHNQMVLGIFRFYRRNIRPSTIILRTIRLMLNILYFKIQLPDRSDKGSQLYGFVQFHVKIQ